MQSCAESNLRGLLGLVVAFLGAKVVVALAFQSACYIPINAAPSLPVLAFAFGVTLLTVAVFVRKIVLAQQVDVPPGNRRAVGHGIEKRLPARGILDLSRLRFLSDAALASLHAHRYQMRHTISRNPFCGLGFRSLEHYQNSTPFSSPILGDSDAIPEAYGSETSHLNHLTSALSSQTPCRIWYFCWKTGPDRSEAEVEVVATYELYNVNRANRRGTVRLEHKSWVGYLNLKVLDPNTEQSKWKKQRVGVLGRKSEMSKRQAQETLEKIVAQKTGGTTQPKADEHIVTLGWFIRNRFFPLREGSIHNSYPANCSPHPFRLQLSGVS